MFAWIHKKNFFIKGSTRKKLISAVLQKFLIYTHFTSKCEIRILKCLYAMGFLKGRIAILPLSCKRELTSRAAIYSRYRSLHQHGDSHLHWRAVYQLMHDDLKNNLKEKSRFISVYGKRSHFYSNPLTPQIGFVLLAILFFLSMELMMSGYLYVKIRRAWEINRIAWQMDVLRQRVQSQTLNIEKSSDDFTRCRFQQPMSFFKKTFAEWQSSACSSQQEDMHYLFFIESMGQNPCVHIAYHPNQIAVYERFNYIAWSEQFSPAVIYVQSLVVRSGETNRFCVSSKKIVYLGRQWQHELQGEDHEIE